jgi:hypothetical protein
MTVQKSKEKNDKVFLDRVEHVFPAEIFMLVLQYRVQHEQVYQAPYNSSRVSLHIEP